MNKRIETITLDVTLTEKELLERAASASELHNKILQLEAEFDRIKNKYKNTLGLETASRDNLMKIILERKEPRAFECELVPNFKENIMEYIFKGEIMKKRPLSPDEFQQKMI